LKVKPNYFDFLKLTKKGNLIPIYTEILSDLETPLSLLIKLKKTKNPFLLESIVGGEHIARYSFVGTNPYQIIKSKNDIIILEKRNGIKNWKLKYKDPLEEIKYLMKKYKYVKLPQLPRFTGGFVGYISYDLIRFFEKIPDKNKDDLGLPEMIFSEIRDLFIFDHIKQRLIILTHVFLEEEETIKKAYRKAILNIEKLLSYLNKKSKEEKISQIDLKQKGEKYSSNFTKKSFVKIVEKAKKYIRNGDIIQAVLSQRLNRKIKTDDINIYRCLRYINPSPYMYYLNYGNFSIIGSSPEVHVRCESRIAELRPIAGTRKRGKTEEKDKFLEKELLSDSKEKAEHIMLVDLGRNDLGRVCKSRTVKVTELMTIEKYSHVMHIVSNVIGKLKNDKDNFDLIRATFPAGTVTGAPKIRAMEIIDELENLKRGPYAGCIGYFSYSNNLDSCITIRTIITKNNYAYIQAGAGIVADSIPENEYKETLNKAKALTFAIDLAEKV
jgi:anthranilate synthase component 1